MGIQGFFIPSIVARRGEITWIGVVKAVSHDRRRPVPVVSIVSRGRVFILKLAGIRTPIAKSATVRASGWANGQRTIPPASLHRQRPRFDYLSPLPGRFGHLEYLLAWSISRRVCTRIYRRSATRVSQHRGDCHAGA